MLTAIQQQFMAFWKKQSLGKQITIVALVLATLILAPVLVNWATAPSYSVAYNGLSETDAAQIVQKLDENNITYRLKSSGTIEVPSDQVYSTRLLMARDGLPQSSTVGYELFSGTSMLGMTEFSQKVNYQRAIEGELERTIGSIDAVEAVRVHLVIPEKSLLTSAQSLATASVTMQVNPGKVMDASQVRAITHLVASSVEGLKPENVVVVDGNGNLLASGSGAEGEMNMTVKDDQRAIETAYAAEVQNRVQSILDKILGPIVPWCKPPWKWTGLSARPHRTRSRRLKLLCEVRRRSMKVPTAAAQRAAFRGLHRTCPHRWLPQPAQAPKVINVMKNSEL